MNDAFGRRARVALVAIMPSVLLVGCGGDGGGPADDAPGGSTAPWSSGGANGTLSGRVWAPAIPGFLDLDTGRVVTVADGSVFPRRDGAEFAEIQPYARFVEDPECEGRMSDSDRVVLRDAATGVATGGFDVFGSLSGLAKVSPDGTRVAVRYDDPTGCSSREPALTVFDRDGRRIIRALPRIGDFAWLPDNRLVFTVDDAYIGVESEPDTLSYDTIADLSDVPGEPGALEVSPDGLHVLFEMVTDGSSFLETVDYREATVWHVGIDGTALVPLIDSSRVDQVYGPFVNAPAFSPDGGALLVTENFTGGGGVALYGQDGPDFPIITGIDYAPVVDGSVTQVVPVSMLPVRLPPSSWTAEGVRPVFERDAAGTTALARLRPLEGRAWVPAPEERAAWPGDLPAPNGRPNRGLQGSLYRTGEDATQDVVLERLDLATGTVTEVPVPSEVVLDDAYSDSFAVSPDGSLLIAFEYDLLETDAFVFDADGVLLADFALETSTYHHMPESPPVFAPNGEPLVAWAYDDGDFGQGVAVLDVLAGRFVVRFDDGYWDEVAWFPNGDLLLVDAGELWRAARTADGFAAPLLLGDTRDTVRHARVHPDGERVVFVGGRQILMLDLDTGETHRVTSWTETAEAYPEFSPDGSFILFRKLGDFDFGWPWIVSSEARDVLVHEPETTAAAMRVGEGTELDWRVGRGEIVWR